MHTCCMIRLAAAAAGRTTSTGEGAAPGSEENQLRRCFARGTWLDAKTQARSDPKRATVSGVSAGGRLSLNKQSGRFPIIRHLTAGSLRRWGKPVGPTKRGK